MIKETMNKITLQEMADVTGLSVGQMSKVVNGQQSIGSFTRALALTKLVTGKPTPDIDDLMVWMRDGGTAEQRKAAVNPE